MKDIHNVEIISTEEVATNDIQGQSKVIVKRPIAKRAGRSISESVSSTVQAGGSQAQASFKKPVESNQQQVEQTANGKIGSGTCCRCILCIKKKNLVFVVLADLT